MRRVSATLATSSINSIRLAAAERLIGKHWPAVSSLTEPHLKDQILSFNDAHFMMALCGARQYSKAEELIENSIASKEISGKDVNENILRAILAYSREKFAECVEYLHPIRYQVTFITSNENIIALSTHSTDHQHRRQRRAARRVQPAADCGSLEESATRAPQAGRTLDHRAAGAEGRVAADQPVVAEVEPRAVNGNKRGHKQLLN